MSGFSYTPYVPNKKTTSEILNNGAVSYPGTDRPIYRSRAYRFRKKYCRPVYGMWLGLILLLIIVNQALKDDPFVETVSNIQYRRNRITISIRADDPEKPPVYTFRQTAVNQIALDIEKGRLRFDSHRQYRHGDVGRIDITRYGKGMVRVLITFSNLKDIPQCKFVDDPPHFLIHFNRYLDDKFIVVIDPGHGGDNIGARGKNGTLEKTVNLDIAKRLRDLLREEEDVRVFLTREEDESVGLFERRQMAQIWDADLFLSIHANSASNHQANWSEIYYADNHSMPAARIVLQELGKDLNNGTGLLRRRRFAVIRSNYARLGALLVETLYMSNTRGEALLSSESGRRLISASLHRSLTRILDEERVVMARTDSSGMVPDAALQATTADR